jgi:hypothetical protein
MFVDKRNFLKILFGFSFSFFFLKKNFFLENKIVLKRDQSVTWVLKEDDI